MFPSAMKQAPREGALQHFHEDEILYRRVPLFLWDDPEVGPEINVIELPDLSTGRSRFAHPEWLRFAPRCRDGAWEAPYFPEWGVIGFAKGDIPPERWDAAVYRFTFRAVHDPEEWNYPHTEVRVLRNEAHLATSLADELPAEVHLLWRELLLRKVKVFLRPGEPATTRPHRPASHKPELPIPRP